jgi:hypothetical protein
VGNHEKDLETDVPDLDGLGLGDVEKQLRAMLPPALARIRDQVVHSSETRYAGFQSSL